jgi:hypothetical protein
MNKELTFTAYFRANYLKQAVHSWNQTSNILDWPVSYRLEPTNEQVQDAMINEFNQLECKSLLGDINLRRLGVLRNPHAALTAAFDAGNEFVVLAEDDVVVSDDCLEYFEWAMETYKEDNSVLGVLAYSRIRMENCVQGPSDVSRTKVFCPLIWGTWKDRWESIIEPNWDLDYSSGEADGSCAGWDWNMMRVAVRENKDFLYPAMSRSTHIGRFGGTHASELDFPESQAETFKDQHFKTGEFREVFIRDERLNDYYPGSN